MHLAEQVFRYRSAAFACVFGTGFAGAAFDHTPTAVRLARLLPPDAGRPDVAVRATFWLGALCVLAAAALRTWATAPLRSSVVHDDAVHAEALVADGPYRRVRNPLYLGGFLLAVGFAPMPPIAGALWMVGGVLAIDLTLIAVEERAPAGVVRPAWRQAFVGETFFWAFALAAVTMAATLDARWAGLLPVAGVAVGALQGRRERTSGAALAS